ncbi:unnamed protein product [Dracunculus medinensis]|uniref:Uncharacterized protein n=1 Tax=Dracunculus medinensis TaxID=318479 RepID=A0A0N4U0X8_DRAME|nr:unnamed protein product [Dracunculus medinensis]
MGNEHDEKQQSISRQSPPINSGKIIMLNDSGTESDVDELEQLDSMSNGMADVNAIDRSPPKLTSSPPVVADFDTISWNSSDCESGVVFGDKNNDFDDLLLDSFYLFEEKQDVNGLSVSQCGELNTNGAAGGRNFTNPSKPEKRGAFRPVNKMYNQSDIKGEKNSSGITTTVSTTNHGIVGEKRCYGNVDNENGQSSSFVLPVRNSNGGQEKDRETLIAARRQPVKLIIYNSVNVENRAKNTNVYEQNDYCPVKKGRLNPVDIRPSLNFEKMRQRMLMNTTYCIGSVEFLESSTVTDHDIEKRKNDWAVVSPSSTSCCLSSCNSSSTTNIQFRSSCCQQLGCKFRINEGDSATDSML